jgi:hypothetical protein
MLYRNTNAHVRVCYPDYLCRHIESGPVTFGQIYGILESDSVIAIPVA